MEFGTGGLRGVIGAGSNRINIYTVRKATQGFAEYIKDSGEEAKRRGVVIAYGNRRQSFKFAQNTAGVLAANGIKAYLFESLRTTPELSFAVRHLNCFGGVVITASPAPTPADKHATCKAAVPLAIATAYLSPVISQSFFSSSNVLGPVVIKSLFRTSETALISSSSINCLP